MFGDVSFAELSFSDALVADIWGRVQDISNSWDNSPTASNTWTDVSASPNTWSQ
jgi:hypothetical protein